MLLEQKPVLTNRLRHMKTSQGVNYNYRNFAFGAYKGLQEFSLAATCIHKLKYFSLLKISHL